MKVVLVCVLAFASVAHGGLLSFLTAGLSGGGGGGGYHGGHGGGYNRNYGPRGGGYPNGPVKTVQIIRQPGPSYGNSRSSGYSGGYNTPIRTIKIIHENSNGGVPFSGPVKTIKIIRENDYSSGGGYSVGHNDQHVKTLQIVNQVADHDVGYASGGQHGAVKTVQIVQQNANAAGGYGGHSDVGGYSNAGNVKTLQIQSHAAPVASYSDHSAADYGGGYQNGGGDQHLKTLQIVRENAVYNHGYNAGHGGGGTDHVKTLQIVQDQQQHQHQHHDVGNYAQNTYSNVGGGGEHVKTLQIVQDQQPQHHDYSSNTYSAGGGGVEQVKTVQIVQENHLGGGFSNNAYGSGDLSGNAEKTIQVIHENSPPVENYHHQTAPLVQHQQDVKTFQVVQDNTINQNSWTGGASGSIGGGVEKTVQVIHEQSPNGFQASQGPAGWGR